jgi:sugar phosphate permease
MTHHRNWMIRSHAMGIGATAATMVFFPICAFTGTPPTGLVADPVFLGARTVCVALAEVLVRRIC